MRGDLKEEGAKKRSEFTKVNRHREKTPKSGSPRKQNKGEEKKKK